MYHEMTVYGFTIDTISRRPVVLLKGTDGATTVPLWISVVEGVSIAADLIGHDLANQGGKSDFLTSLLKRLGLHPFQITMERNDSGAIAAAAWLKNGGQEIRIDVNLIEALNLTLAYKIPLMVSTGLVDWATKYSMQDETVVRESDARRYVDFLEGLDPSQMGKYPM